MDRIRTIIEKEWAEVFKNRLVLFTVVGLPLIFVIIPLVALRFTAGGMNTGDTVDAPLSLAQACQVIPGITGKDCLTIYLANLTALLEKRPPAAWNRSWRLPSPPSNCWQARPWPQPFRLSWQPGARLACFCFCSPSPGSVRSLSAT
jgi:hypothetical protein